MSSNEARIVIEGNTVKYQQTYTSYEVELSDLLNVIARPVTTPRLPRDCVFSHVSSSKELYVVELTPGLRFVKTVRMQKGVRLSMPWQYFVFELTPSWDNSTGNLVLSNYYLLWSMNKVVDFESAQFFEAFVPNVSNYGTICFGNTAPSSYLPLDERINTIVNEFYSPDSIFNFDMGDHLPPFYRSHREWALASARDNNVWSTWDLDAHHIIPRSFDDFVGGVIPQGAFTSIIVEENLRRINYAQLCGQVKDSMVDHVNNYAPNLFKNIFDLVRGGSWERDQFHDYMLGVIRSLSPIGEIPPEFTTTTENTTPFMEIEIEYVDDEDDLLIDPPADAEVLEVLPDE